MYCLSVRRNSSSLVRNRDWFLNNYFIEKPVVTPPPRRNDDHHQDEGAGGFQEPRAIAYTLGWCSSPSLSAYLQAVCSRGVCSPSQARGHAPAQVVQVRHHLQLVRPAQVRGNCWRPPDALLTHHQQRPSHQDPHRRRRRAQCPVRRDIR